MVTPFIGGLWDESAQRLTLWLAADMAGVSSPAVMFTGYLFTDTENLTGVVGSVVFTLAGQIEHFALLDPLRIGLSQTRDLADVTRDLGAIRDFPLSVPPKVFEAVRSHFGVPDGVLNVLVPEVVLQSPRVVAIVGELEPTGMAQHVRMDREWHLGGFPDALDEAVETDGADWPAALGNERRRPWGNRGVAYEEPASRHRKPGARWESRDEQLNQAIEIIKEMLAQRTGEAANVIEGTAEPVVLPASEVLSQRRYCRG